MWQIWLWAALLTKSCGYRVQAIVLVIDQKSWFYCAHDGYSTTEPAFWLLNMEKIAVCNVYLTNKGSYKKKSLVNEFQILCIFKLVVLEPRKGLFFPECGVSLHSFCKVSSLFPQINTDVFEKFGFLIIILKLNKLRLFGIKLTYWFL